MIHEWTVLIGVICGFLVLIGTIGLTVRALVDARLMKPFARRRRNLLHRPQRAATAAKPLGS
jgi:hypothetical protein